ncbi:hypothetical protein [Kitasatospora sp. NPDC094011]
MPCPGFAEPRPADASGLRRRVAAGPETSDAVDQAVADLLARQAAE